MHDISAAPQQGASDPAKAGKPRSRAEGQLANKLRPQSTPLPADGFLRLKQVLALIPVSASVWWQGVREGRFPKGVKLSANTTAWRAADIARLIEQLSTQ